MKQLLTRIARYLFLERTANRRSFRDFVQEFEGTGVKIVRRIQAADDSAHNRQQLGHIIGIERWGQSRLRTLLGSELVMDEYDVHAPLPDQPLAVLRDEFEAARAATVALVNDLESHNVAYHAGAPHNQFGEMNVRTWLQYLLLHANLESKRIR